MGNPGYVKAVFLQARLDSVRLPQKALLTLCGKPVLEHVMDGLKRIDSDLYVLLTDESSAKDFKPIAENCGFKLFVGDKENVLKRYSDASRYYGPDYIIRATGDNPLVSPVLAEELYTLHLLENADYSGFLGMPYGAGVEIISAKSLFKAEDNAVSSYDLEHVCPYLYNHPEKFIINRPVVRDSYFFPDGRITLDTEEDYQSLRNIFIKLYKQGPPDLLDVIGYLRVRQKLDGAFVG